MTAHFPKVSFSLYEELSVYCSTAVWHRVPNTANVVQHPEHAAVMTLSITDQVGWVTLGQQLTGPRSRIPSRSASTLGSMAFSSVCL